MIPGEGVSRLEGITEQVLAGMDSVEANITARMNTQMAITVSHVGYNHASHYFYSSGGTAQAVTINYG